MYPYRNLNHETGVIAYRPGAHDIAVQFKNGATYLYTSHSAGLAAIMLMKLLAAKGAGLTTYINQYVKGRYEAKIK